MANQYDTLLIKKWLRNNRGVLTRIAVKHHVVNQYVSQVCWGVSSSRPESTAEIERDLRAAGWPGVSSRKVN